MYLSHLGLRGNAFGLNGAGRDGGGEDLCT